MTFVSSATVTRRPHGLVSLVSISVCPFVRFQFPGVPIPRIFLKHTPISHCLHLHHFALVFKLQLISRAHPQPPPDVPRHGNLPFAGQFRLLFMPLLLFMPVLPFLTLSHSSLLSPSLCPPRTPCSLCKTPAFVFLLFSAKSLLTLRPGLTFPPHQFDRGSAATMNPQYVLVLHQFFSNHPTRRGVL